MGDNNNSSSSSSGGSNDIAQQQSSSSMLTPAPVGRSPGPPARKKFAVDVSSGSSNEKQRGLESSSQQQKSTLSSSSSSSQQHDAVITGAKRLAVELTEFCMNHPTTVGDGGTTTFLPKAVEVSKAPTDANVADLQLSCCRKLRELLPNNKDLLLTAQERNWIPLMLSWLNLHDRPAVQVEALLALTNIAEQCAQQSYLLSAAQQTSAVAAAAQAAVSAVKGAAPSWDKAMESVAASAGLSDADKLLGNPELAASKYAAAAAAAAVAPYPSLVAPAPGSVPFPPLSFSQTLSPDAVAAFDASLTNTIQSCAAAGSATAGAAATGPQHSNLSQSGSSSSSNNHNRSTSSSASQSAATSAASSWTMPPAPLFPSAPSVGGAVAGVGATGGINFTSLAPPPGGAHSAVPSNAFLPPPTPVAGTGSNSNLSSFPQQLSASSQHLLLRHADAIPTLISLLSSPSREVYEQAMWILGSISAGDSPGGAGGIGGSGGNGTTSMDGRGGSAADVAGNNGGKSVSARDVILAAGVMNQLLRCLEAHPNNLSLQRIGSWTLSNLVDGIFQQANNNSGAPSSSSSLTTHGGSSSGGAGGSNSTKAAMGGGSSNASKSGDYSSADEIEMPVLLPVLRHLLNQTDSEILSYTCWTLSHLCDGPSSHIAAVVTTQKGVKVFGGKPAPPGGLVPRLVELLMHPSWRVTKPALRTIGNIVCAECSEDSNDKNSSTTDYTEVILECCAVPRLKELVTHSNREIQKEACWTLSNIAAGTVDQIQAVIDSGAITPLVKLVRDKKTDQEVRSEACWVVLNATSCGSDQQIEVLVDEGCVAVLGVLLTEASMVMMALEGLERVLQVEETREILRREKKLLIESGEREEDGGDSNNKVAPTLVSASLIEKARESHSSSAVTKRADRIWKQHFVSCALCKKSYSKHRTADASFCEECKCYVCSNCDCSIYHLDYQEELWAKTESVKEAKKNAKKSKNKKKKEKRMQKKKLAEQQQAKETGSSSLTADQQQDTKQSNVDATKMIVESNSSKGKSLLSSQNGDDLAADLAGTADEDNSPQNQIDFVLYLQQTGSIIALAKLMDALEYGGDDYDEELDDYERKMIQEQQQMRIRTK